jgi:alkylation response protein AidB-like acyl-CoA dehydrogenase
MRFDLSNDQRIIKESVRELCAAKGSVAIAQGIADGHGGPDLVWAELVTSGWNGVAIAHEYGGFSLGVVELALVVEELGFVLAPATFLGNVAAGLVVTSAGNHEQRNRILPGVASGQRRSAFGVLDRRSGGAHLLDSTGAEHAVLAAEDRAVIVDPAKHEVELIEGIDPTRRLFRLESAEGEWLSGDVVRGLDQVEVLIAAELVGVAQHALDLAVTHAKERRQFGRPIGAYQAVSHRCADMLIAVEGARATVLNAAWIADHDPENLSLASSVAKVAAAQAALSASTGALQILGGIGFTWEHPIHLFLRRATASAHFLGGVGLHLDRAAALTGLADPISVPASAKGERSDVWT